MRVQVLRVGEKQQQVDHVSKRVDALTADLDEVVHVACLAGIRAQSMLKCPVVVACWTAALDGTCVCVCVCID